MRPFLAVAVHLLILSACSSGALTHVAQSTGMLEVGGPILEGTAAVTPGGVKLTVRLPQESKVEPLPPEETTTEGGE